MKSPMAPAFDAVAKAATIGISLTKTGGRIHLIWPSNLAAPLAVFDISSNASRPPAA